MVPHIVRCNLDKGLAHVQQAGAHDQSILVAGAAGTEGVGTKVGRRDLGSRSRFGDKEHIILLDDRHHGQGHARADVADQDFSALGLDQLSGLGNAGFRVAAIVLLDDLDGPSGDRHRAVGGVL
jgi:hypothetical protein